VVSVVDELPDNPLGNKDVHNPAGNHVVIDAGDGKFVFLGHLRKGSTAVKAGERIARRQAVGRVGNSGNTDFPHLHLHVQDHATLNQGQGFNPVFGGIEVELNGKAFQGVTWPLIRGLFVQAR
jgi:murein DD-endopeptidase MepM/ murein hydrolase activator NlpD